MYYFRSFEILRDIFGEWMSKLVKEQVKLYLIWDVFTYYYKIRRYFNCILTLCL